MVVSLPKDQKAPPKEYKLLHAVRLVKFEVFKSKIHGLRRCVALLGLMSLEKMAHENACQKLCIRSQEGQKTDIDQLLCSSYLS